MKMRGPGKAMIKRVERSRGKRNDVKQYSLKTVALAKIVNSSNDC